MGNNSNNLNSRDNSPVDYLEYPMKEIVIFIILMAFNDYTWYHVGKRIGEKKPLNLQEAIKARDKYIKIRKNYD